MRFFLQYITIASSTVAGQPFGSAAKSSLLYGFHSNLFVWQIRRIIPLPLDRSQGVNRAANALSAPIENMGIDHVVISDSAPVSVIFRLILPVYNVLPQPRSMLLSVDKGVSHVENID